MSKQPDETPAQDTPELGKLIASARSSMSVRVVSILVKGVLAVVFAGATIAITVQVVNAAIPINRIVLALMGAALAVNLGGDTIFMLRPHNEQVFVHKKGLIFEQDGQRREVQWRDLRRALQIFPPLLGDRAVRFELEPADGGERIVLRNPLPLQVLAKAIIAQITPYMVEEKKTPFGTRMWVSKRAKD